MFKIVANPTFAHVVKVQVPVDGGHREESFRATFRVLPVEQVQKFNLMSEKGTRDFLVAAVERLDDLADEAGNPVSYSDEVRDQVLTLPYVRLALAEAYSQAVSKAKAGN